MIKLKNNQLKKLKDKKKKKTKGTSDSVSIPVKPMNWVT